MNRRSKNLALAGSLAAVVAALSISAQAAGMQGDMNMDKKPMAAQCDSMMKTGSADKDMDQKSSDMGMNKMGETNAMHADCGDHMMKHDGDSKMPMKEQN